jgi:hypothetical protein
MQQHATKVAEKLPFRFRHRCAPEVDMREEISAGGFVQVVAL